MLSLWQWIDMLSLWQWIDMLSLWQWIYMLSLWQWIHMLSLWQWIDTLSLWQWIHMLSLWPWIDTLSLWQWIHMLSLWQWNTRWLSKHCHKSFDGRVIHICHSDWMGVVWSPNVLIFTITGRGPHGSLLVSTLLILGWDVTEDKVTRTVLIYPDKGPHDTWTQTYWDEMSMKLVTGR